MVKLPLAQAAKAVRKSPSTLTRACNVKDEKKRLKFTLDEDGNRLFAIPDLIERYGELHQDALDSHEERTSMHEDAPAKKHAPDAENALVQARALHEERTSALVQQVDDLKQERNRLIDDVDAWKGEADKWRKHADNSLRLLTDQSEKNKVSDGVGQGSDSSTKWWLSSTAMALILAGAVYAWHDEIGEVWQSVTVTETIIEPVAQSQTP